MSKVFFGGTPTAIDVRKLVDVFGVPDVGTEITHEQVEACIGLKRTQTRYRTVTLAWRGSLLREHNVDLSAERGTGFRALAPDERVSAGVVGVQSGVRKQMRSIKRADMAVTDDPVLMHKQNTLRRYGVLLAAESTSLMKTIEPPKAPDQLPRPTLIIRQKTGGAA